MPSRTKQEVPWRFLVAIFILNEVEGLLEMANSMKIDISHIAKLANLTLTADEEKKFEKQLEDTLATINQLNEIDTENTEITSQVTGLENVMDDDISRPSLSQKDALSNAKNTHNGFVVVKAILED